MKFPGKRKNKHYFPVAQKSRIALEVNKSEESGVYIVGIDQMIVDIEASVPYEDLSRWKLQKGESIVLDDEEMETIYQELQSRDLIEGEFAGGSVGNTLHNYSVLSDSKSVALGVMSENIKIGDYAFKYICTTNSHVDLSYLKPCQGPMGRALCLITPDHERTFAISKGVMNELDESSISEEVIKNSSALLISTYLLRDEEAPLFKATIKSAELAKKNSVPVILAMGTGQLIREKKDFLLNFINDYVTVAAMNEEESRALTDLDDPLRAGEKVLDFVDLALITVGERGLFMAGHCDEKCLRATQDKIHSKSIASYNEYEYSRPMRKKDCDHPRKIYTHLNPFKGGPEEIMNTNGAGDAALSALLHDIASNRYHYEHVPTSPKHSAQFLTYSSIHQVAKYCNRASYEVLKQNSPRLAHGLPEKEDGLEESYWSF